MYKPVTYFSNEIVLSLKSLKPLISHLEHFCSGATHIVLLSYFLGFCPRAGEWAGDHGGEMSVRFLQHEIHTEIFSVCQQV